MKYLKKPITEVTFIDFLGKKKFIGGDEYWFNFLQDMFFIGTGDGLVQIYCLPDLEV